MQSLSNIQASMSIRDRPSLSDTPSGEKKSNLTSSQTPPADPSADVEDERRNTVFFLLKVSHSGRVAVRRSGITLIA